jgi:hypothetical protein
VKTVKRWYLGKTRALTHIYMVAPFGQAFNRQGGKQAGRQQRVAILAALALAHLGVDLFLVQKVPVQIPVLA